MEAEGEDSDKPGLHAALLATPTASSLAEQPSRLTSGRLRARPALVPAAPDSLQALGLGLPAPMLTVQRIAEALGYDYKLGQRVVDCGSQGPGPIWNLHQWRLYWRARLRAQQAPEEVVASGSARHAGDDTEDEGDSGAVKKDRHAAAVAPSALRGIAGDAKRATLHLTLPLADTSLQDVVVPPSVVRGSDLVSAVWPPGSTLRRPQLGAAAQMAPAGAALNFCLMPGGAAQWCHVISGRMRWVAAPPTAANLTTYAAWSRAAKAAGVFVGRHLHSLVPLDLGPGDTAFLPGGWLAAVAAVDATLAVGGVWMQEAALSVQLQAWSIEEFLNIPARQRFPAFQELVWHAAIAAVARARTVAGLTAEDLCTRAAAVAEQRAKGAAGHPVGAGVSGVAGDGRAAQPAEGHSPAAIQTALHRKRSRKQARPTSAADTAEAGRPPKLLLKLSLSNGGAGRGAAVAEQVSNRTVQLPPPATGYPPADEQNTEERKPLLDSTQHGKSSNGGTARAADQPAGTANNVVSPSVTWLSAEDRAAAADWLALLAALRGWSEGRREGMQLPPAIRDPQALLDELEACMLAIGLPVVPPPTLDLHAVDPSALLPSVPALASPSHAPAAGAAATSPPAIADDESGGSLRSSFDLPAALQAADSGADARHGGMKRRDKRAPGQKRRRQGSGGRGAKARRVAQTPEDDDDFIVDDDNVDEEEAEDLREPSSEADSDLSSIAASGSDLDSEPDASDEVVSSAEEEGGRSDAGGGRAAKQRTKRTANGAKRAAAGAANPGLKVRMVPNLHRAPSEGVGEVASPLLAKPGGAVNGGFMNAKRGAGPAAVSGSGTQRGGGGRGKLSTRDRLMKKLHLGRKR